MDDATSQYPYHFDDVSCLAVEQESFFSYPTFEFRKNSSLNWKYKFQCNLVFQIAKKNPRLVIRLFFLLVYFLVYGKMISVATMAWSIYLILIGCFDLVSVKWWIGYWFCKFAMHWLSYKDKNFLCKYVLLLLNSEFSVWLPKGLCPL